MHKVLNNGALEIYQFVYHLAALIWNKDKSIGGLFSYIGLKFDFGILWAEFVLTIISEARLACFSPQISTQILSKWTSLLRSPNWNISIWKNCPWIGLLGLKPKILILTADGCIWLTKQASIPEAKVLNLLQEWTEVHWHSQQNSTAGDFRLEEHNRHRLLPHEGEGLCLLDRRHGRQGINQYYITFLQ